MDDHPFDQTGSSEGLTRRDALRIAVAGGIGLGAGTIAGTLPAFAATAPLKGNLKHSVARWTFRSCPSPSSARR